MSEGVLDIRKYYEYIDLGKESRTHYLMISELIDNSIGSFDKHYGEGEWGTNKLKINIEINHVVDEKKINTLPGIDNISYQEGSYIKISDNAFGVGVERIDKILKLNEKDTSGDSIMNVHGRGLKQSGFYLGLGVEVLTKGKDGALYIDNKPLEKGLDSEVVFKHKKSIKEDRGTLVKISPLRTKRRITKNKLLDIVRGLSERYWKLIERGLMILNIKYAITENGKTDVGEINNDKFKHADLVASLSEDIDLNVDLIKEHIKIARKQIERHKKTSTDIEFNVYSKLVKDVQNEIEKLLLSKDRDIEFRWTSTLDLIGEEDKNKNKIKVNFWSNSKNKINKVTGKNKVGYSKYKGISVFQGPRAILHPPENEDNKPYVDFMKGGKISGTADYKFAGEFNIKGTNISTTTDKSNIEFNDPVTKEHFDKQLKIVYKIFEVYLEQCKKPLSHTEGEYVTKSEAIETIDFIEDRFKRGKSIITGERDSILLGEDGSLSSIKLKLFKNNEETYIIKLNVNREALPGHKPVIKTNYIKSEINDIDWEVEATTFTAHPIWKKFNEKRNSFKEIISIFTIIFIIQEINGRIQALKEGYSLDNWDKSSINPNMYLNKTVIEDFTD